MKYILVIILLIFGTTLFSQQKEIKAQLFIHDTSLVSGGVVIFPISRDTTKISDSDTAVIYINSSKNLVFYFMWAGWKSKLYRSENLSNFNHLLNIKIPDTLFYREFQEIKTCPICLKSKPVVQIKYGMPTKELAKKAKRGDIRLGGCVTYDYSPLYFCKEDNFEF